MRYPAGTVQWFTAQRRHFFSWAVKNRADLLVLGFFIALACAYWFPLPFYLRTHQTENPAVDPVFNQWIIAWGQRALTHYPWNFFDANMFYPYSQTLTWGDHLFALTLITLPITPILGVLGTYNVLLIGATALSGYFLYLFIRELAFPRPVSVLGGALWALLYYRAGVEMGHIQILSTQWIPLVLLYTERVRRTGRGSIGLGISAFLLLATNVYLVMFTILGYGMLIAVGLVARQFTLSRLLLLARAWVVAGICALPLYWGSLTRQASDPLVRSVDNQFAMLLNNLVPMPMPGRIIREIIERMGGQLTVDAPFNTFGWVGTFLVAIGLVRLLWEWRQWQRNWVYWAGVFITVSLVLIALGRIIWWYGAPLWDRNIFFLGAFHYIPGFEALRAPIRSWLVVSLFLSVLSAWSLQWLFTKVTRPWQWGIVLVAIAWTFIEVAPAPLKTYPTYDLAAAPVYSWLAEQPGEFPILELPVFAGTGNGPNDRMEGRRIFYAMHHWKRRVSGGISPHIPQSYVDQMRMFQPETWSPLASEQLREWGVKYVILAKEDSELLGLSSEQYMQLRTALLQDPHLELVQTFGATEVFAVKGVI